ASTRYFAQDNPASPAPAIATRIVSYLLSNVLSLSHSLLYFTFRYIFFQIVEKAVGRGQKAGGKRQKVGGKRQEAGDYFYLFSPRNAHKVVSPLP
ncbi:MAG: hypothetical protein ACK5UO_05415, partial [Microcystis sp.]|uniref:hypothetical protein n=1 Tax=Microcystis sp. TaxID=1127 RepID=UPI00391DA2ED